MKKLLTLLFLAAFVLTFTAAPVLAQTTIDDGDDMDINIDADIQAPTFDYTEQTPLSFGIFYASSAASDVSVSHLNVWSNTGNYVKQDGDTSAAGDHSRALNLIEGVNGMTFTMTFANNTTVTHATIPAETLVVNAITAEFDNGGGVFAVYNSTDSVTMAANCYVAFEGTLVVGAGVEYGVYNGVLPVAMDYE